MEKLKNKNTIVLIISAILILIAIVIAVVASTSSGKDKKETTTKAPQESVSIDLGSIADMNNTNPDVATTKKANSSFSFEPGKYKVATKDDPLGLRLEPNTSSDRLIYVPKGHQVEVLAVWEDWGYVVYEQTGGWLSMNYLELVSSSKKTTEKSTTTPAEQ